MPVRPVNFVAHDYEARIWVLHKDFSCRLEEDRLALPRGENPNDPTSRQPPANRIAALSPLSVHRRESVTVYPVMDGMHDVGLAPRRMR